MRVESRFDVLLLADKNLRYQQNLTGRKIALVELPTNRWPFLKLMASRIVNLKRKMGVFVELALSEVFDFGFVWW